MRPHWQLTKGPIEESLSKPQSRPRGRVHREGKASVACSAGTGLLLLEAAAPPVVHTPLHERQIPWLPSWSWQSETKKPRARGRGSPLISGVCVKVLQLFVSSICWPPPAASPRQPTHWHTTSESDGSHSGSWAGFLEAGLGLTVWILVDKLVSNQCDSESERGVTEYIPLIYRFVTWQPAICNACCNQHIRGLVVLSIF